MKNNFIPEIIKRNFFHQCTNQDELINLINLKPIKAYIGFDCTAPSLHVGSLLQIMCLRMLQKYGHQPIILLGGGTTLIGDPSGKDTTRKILEDNIKDLHIIAKGLLEYETLTGEEIKNLIKGIKPTRDDDLGGSSNNSDENNEEQTGKKSPLPSFTKDQNFPLPN